MNREKKQFVVLGVLGVLILGVGAFQFTRTDPPAPPAAAKEKPKDKATTDPAALEPLKYQLPNLPAKDPFEVAAFVSASNPQPGPPVTASPKVGGNALASASKEKIEKLPPSDFGSDFSNPKPGGDPSIKPLEPPVKPSFGYTLVGLIDGTHPMAVFDDGKGNQQLVEVGQSVGPNAKVTQISGGKVRVKFNAETLVFNVGGNTNAK